MTAIKYWIARRLLGMEQIGCIPKLETDAGGNIENRRMAWCDTFAPDSLVDDEDDGCDYFDAWAFMNETET